MQQRFLPENRDTISRKYEVCSLYQVLNRGRNHYALLSGIMPCTEEVFFDVLRILDDLKESPEEFVENRIPHLFFDLFAEYRNLDKSLSEDEPYKMASLLFGCLLCIVSCSSNIYYGVSVKNAMCGGLAKVPNVHFDIMQEFSVFLDGYSKQLGLWVDEYLNSDEFFSDEIRLLINPNIKTKSRRHKPKKPKNPHTLFYTQVDNQTKNKRLQIVMRLWIDWGWIEEPESVDCFFDFFAGKPKHCNLKWIGTPAAILNELLRRLLAHPNVKNDETGCSAKSIIENQFSLTASYNSERIKSEEKSRIELVMYILNPKNPLPTLDQLSEDGYDMDEVLKEVYLGNLHIIKDLNPQ
ncbi:MAG: hypothetical protein MJZ99_10175 [Bacteroidales bacterium]|nr:hypothetical protein [Bacteroidales bacterium]